MYVPAGGECLTIRLVLEESTHDIARTVERGLGFEQWHHIEPAIFRKFDRTCLVSEKQNFEYMAWLFSHRDAIGVDRVGPILALPVVQSVEPFEHSRCGIGQSVSVGDID